MTDLVASSPSLPMHPPASSSPRALWSAIGGLALSVAALGGTMLYQHQQSQAPSVAAVRPVVAPAAIPTQKVAATPVPSAKAASKSIAARRVSAPPVAFTVEPVRAPATARPAAARRG